MGYTESWRRGFSMMAAPLTTLPINIFLVFIILLQSFIDVEVSGGIMFGYLDFDNLPDTNFSCEEKVIGGYYADVETACQMFHVCTIGQNGETTDIKFLCLNGTVFDQETRVCERVDEVDCSNSEAFYDLNLELYGNSAMFRLDGNEQKKTEDITQDSDTVLEWKDFMSRHDATNTTHSIPMAVSLTTKKISVTLEASPQHEYLPTTATHEPQFTSNIQKFLNNNNNNNNNYLKYNYTNNFPSLNSSLYFQHSYNGELKNVDTFKKHFSPSITNTSPTSDVKGSGETAFLLGDNLSETDLNHQIFSTINPPNGKHDYHGYDEGDGMSNINEENNSGQEASTPLLNDQHNLSNSNNNHANQNNRNIFTFQSTTILPLNYYNIKPNSNHHSVTTLNPLYYLHGQAISSTQYSTPSSYGSQQQANKSIFPILLKAHRSPSPDMSVRIMNQDIPIPSTYHQDLTYPPVTVVSISSNFSSSSILSLNMESNDQDNYNNADDVLGTLRSRGNIITNANGANSKHTGQFVNLLKRNITVETMEVKNKIFTLPPPISYDEYQEHDVQSDPFFKDVPKIGNNFQSTATMKKQSNIH